MLFFHKAEADDWNLQQIGGTWKLHVKCRNPFSGIPSKVVSEKKTGIKLLGLYILLLVVLRVLENDFWMFTAIFVFNSIFELFGEMQEQHSLANRNMDVQFRNGVLETDEGIFKVECLATMQITSIDRWPFKHCLTFDGIAVKKAELVGYPGVSAELTEEIKETLETRFLLES